jgi:hypothetical protein
MFEPKEFIPENLKLSDWPGISSQTPIATNLYQQTRQEIQRLQKALSEKEELLTLLVNNPGYERILTLILPKSLY